MNIMHHNTVKVLVLCSLTATISHAQVAIKAKTLHTMNDHPIADGVVVITDGKIAAVGPASEVTIPAGHRVVEAVVATPGLIDARCTVGVSGLLNQRQDQDQLERSSPIQPELRAIDAYNPLDPLVEYVRSYGITTIHTGHAPGEVISGGTIIVKTAGNSVEEALVKDNAMIVATLGPEALKGGNASPGTRAKAIAMLRDQLIKAKEYGAKRKAPPADDAPADEKKAKEPPARDLRLEALAEILDGKAKLAITANRSQDIEAALRLAREFEIDIVLDSASEAYLHIEELADRNTHILLHPTMSRAWGEMENQSFTTAAKLRSAGVMFAFEGGFEDYVPKARIVLFEAQCAVAHGLEPLAALEALTTDAAFILGIENRVGSLRPGLDGDVALFDGDPFEFTTRCTGVVINGELVSEPGR